VRPTLEGLPPFPSGQRETAQHREWLGLYKLKSRLGRRARGQCERCPAPAADGSVFCETHRTSAAARAGELDAAGIEDRERLLELQDSRCPVCGNAVGPRDAIDPGPDGRPRGLLHPACRQLVGVAEAQGPEVLERLRAYLWPGAGRRRA
jgi:hypothetical protein